MSALRTAKAVADDFGCSEWTILELVRQRKVSCVRIATTDSNTRGPVRFTDEQVAEIVAALTVDVPATEAPRRRKRRAS